MTLQEIELLTVESVEFELKVRILQEMGEVDFNVEEWEFSPEDLELELVEYKAELESAELARLEEKARKEDLVLRVEALRDVNYSHAILRPQIPNAKLFIKENIFDNPDHVEAESLLQELEAKDAELHAVIDANAYKDLRKAEYPSIEELIVALYEDDQTAIDALKAKRAEVKLKYPKGSVQ